MLIIIMHSLLIMSQQFTLKGKWGKYFKRPKGVVRCNFISPLENKNYPTCRPLYFYYFMKLFAVGVDPKSTVLINNFFINRGQLVHFLLPHISYFHLLAIITQQSIYDAILYTCIE